MQYSIGQGALHEWGHMIAFDHEDDLIATMNSLYPSGGDLGEMAWRIHEDDAAGLMSVKADASTGLNLTLVGTRSPSVSTDTPYAIDPTNWNFSSVPDGTYYLCVRVDPSNILSETSEVDNTVVSRMAIIEVF